MRDSEYILDEVIRLLKVNLEAVENRLITGNIHNIEDYKYNLGLRNLLHFASHKHKSTQLLRSF